MEFPSISHRYQYQSFIVLLPTRFNLLLILCLLYWCHSVTVTNGLDSSTSTEDPYTILGLSRIASPQDIRRAYKQLAKEWHPDKNQAPNAQGKFVQVNKAYELLSDPSRRKLYDQRGIQEEDYSDRRDSSSFKHFDPFDDVFGFATGGSFHFPFSDGMSYLHKQSVTSKTFDQTVLPKSNTVPQLILFYQDWCMSCARAAPAWRTVTEELQAIGMDIHSVHGERERSVARRMGVAAVPSVVLLIEGYPFHYQDSAISSNKVIGFVRSHIPSDLIDTIDVSNVETFLNSWTDNRVRVLIFGMGNKVKLRYSLLAFHYKERAAFGYIFPSDTTLRSRFGVQKSVDSVMVFKEMPKPAASLSMASDIPQNLLKDLLENNKFLILPRLSSQAVMDAICPTESSVYRRHLCVLLLETENVVEGRNTLRKFAISWAQPRVRFAYVYPDKQRDFFNSLVRGGVKTDNQNLVIFWRQDVSRGAYEWMEWDGSNTSSQKLETTLFNLLDEKKPLAHLIELKELTDEHAKSFLSKILKKLSLTIDFFRTHLTRDTVIQAASLIATLLFVVAGGFIMAYLVRLEEESIAAKARASETQPQRSSATNQTPPRRPTNQSSSRTPGGGGNGSNNLFHNSELKLHEMRSETYNGLVKLIKPGCRTLILLLDSETKGSLLPKFQRCVWPYRKNKSLQFGFMHVDKGGGLTWYKELLLLSLTEPRNLNINPRNCVGTVLSLNGYRRYFCVFHAALPGGAIRRQRLSSGGYRNGGFLGFDSEQDSDEENSDVESRRQELSASANESHPPSILFTSHLLDNLSNWLDRLFEGTTHRYHINYWPDFPVK